MVLLLCLSWNQRLWGRQSRRRYVGHASISWPEEFGLLIRTCMTTSIFWAVGSKLFETLVKRDSSGNFHPACLECMVEPTVWEFKLREDVKFHNGEPFNADVVKYLRANGKEKRPVPLPV